MGWRRFLAICGLGLGMLGALAMTSCSKSDVPSARDSLAITRGFVIPEGDDPRPEVVRIRKGRHKWCSATFVAAEPPTILTASHCLEHLPTVEDSGGCGVSYQDVPARRACVPEGAEGHRGPSDLAVLVFAQGAVTVPGLAALATTEPTAKAPVTLVGFGRNQAGSETDDDSPKGVKRLGKNRILRIAEDTDEKHPTMIYLRGALEGDVETLEELAERNSATAHGDSGGPLFLEIGGRLALIGVTSSGGPTLLGRAFSWFVNLRTPANAGFLEKVLDRKFLEALARPKRPENYTEVCQVKESRIFTDD